MLGDGVYEIHTMNFWRELVGKLPHFHQLSNRKPISDESMRVM